jgi:hypothetical protein
MNIDDFIRKVEQDELADAQYITPVNYSKIRPVSSPQIYQLIRNKKLHKHTCACGRTVIELAEADAYFGPRRENWPGYVKEIQSDDERAKLDGAGS